MGRVFGTLFFSSLSVLYGVMAVGCAAHNNNEMHPPDEPGVLNTHANARDTTPTDQQLAKGADAPPDAKPDEVGNASWYGKEFAGSKTSNGERFDPKLFTAAHKTLPFGTWVEVRRIDTGRTVRVRINDRGPNGKAKSRIIDLSQRAAEDLDLVREGVVRVELRVVSGP
jgi:rare lipoprotein A